MCDTLCVLGVDRTLFAKNSDRPRDEVQVVEIHARRAPGGRRHATHIELDDAGAYALLGSRPLWGWGLEHGVNEHRVAIGNERIFTVDDPRAAPPALTGMDLVRLGLERAATADEALDVMTGLLEEHGQGGRCAEHDDDPYWSSFLITDPHGAWILETSGRRWAARPVHGGAAISNRVTIGLVATRACVAMGAASLTPADLVGTLRHHGHRPWGVPGGDASVVDPPPHGMPEGADGASVCWHVRDVMSTTSAIVAELPASTAAPVRAWVALGSPCASVFVPLDPFGPDGPSGVAMLAEPTTWRRFAALRDRAESADDALVGIRAVLAPLERDLWNAAPGDAWPRVDAALTSLGV
jgi:hypothetical protein